MNGESILVALRFLSAAALFTFLANSNVWMSPVMATILVLGYRLGTFATPAFVRLLGQSSEVGAFALAAGGGLAWYLGYEVIAAPALALGLAVGGYLLKAQAAHSARGAACIAVAMNAGSLAAGAFVALGSERKEFLLLGGTGILLFCTLMAWFQVRVGDAQVRAPRPSLSRGVESSRSLARIVAWSLLGMATGILVFSVFSVLPQTFMASPSHGGHLPSWYGWLISLNAGVIVLCSVPLARYTAQLGLMGGVLPLALGLVTLLLPLFIAVDSFTNACLWVVLISLFECGLSALDHLAAQAKTLLVKEASFGIGASLCVVVSRSSYASNSGLVMGLIGLGLTGAGVLMAQLLNARLAHPADPSSLCSSGN
jgi:hypothetical protein